MERQLFDAILAIIKRFAKPGRPTQTYDDAHIAAVFFWAVIHDRPSSWATQLINWPLDLRRRPLISGSWFSRRLRSPSIVLLLKQVEQHVLRPAPGSDHLVWFLDGKPLPIGGCTKDRQARFGRAAGCQAKGYKLHALIGADHSVAGWRVSPMNGDERTMGRRVVRDAQGIQGYIVADSNYDSNALYTVCDARSVQLVVPRRYGPGRAMGRRHQAAGRLRSKDILENPDPRFGEDLLAHRTQIERDFGQLTSWGGGLTHLPPWVRTHRRVSRWVQAKLTLNALRRTLRQKT